MRPQRGLSVGWGAACQQGTDAGQQGLSLCAEALSVGWGAAGGTGAGCSLSRGYLCAGVQLGERVQPQRGLSVGLRLCAAWERVQQASRERMQPASRGFLCAEVRPASLERVRPASVRYLCAEALSVWAMGVGQRVLSVRWGAACQQGTGAASAGAICWLRLYLLAGMQASRGFLWG